MPFALGTDTGGSISIPAAWCGVFGFRPSTGAWPSGGLVPLSHTRDTVGVIGNSLETVQAVHAIVRMSTGAMSEPLSGEKIRIGIPRADSPHIDALDPKVAEVWQQCLAVLENCTVIELVNVRIDELHRLESTCGAVIEMHEIYHDLGSYLQQLPDPVRYEWLLEQVVREEVRYFLEESLRFRGREGEYRGALRSRRILQECYRDLFTRRRLSGILFPTTPMVAPLLEAAKGSANSDPFEVFARGTRNLNPGSVAGQPVVTIPMGRTTTGLPVGVSLEGAWGADESLIRVARMMSTELSR
ncbi:hypothetical protein G7067_01405 [Leucobacter insecticola]|uniref:Amidase domain-containing protein n=1 Tax=Leucobacter insecticola TaxID=2714934 RepID=A0A6G8FGI4_9MICO|nr:hypothetical protein G7067_01405 [Leucobacter insecticola]